MFKRQLCYIKMTNLLQFTVNVKKIPSSTSAHSAASVRRSRLVCRVDVHVSVSGQQHPKCERAIRLMYLPFFCKILSLSNPTNKNLSQIQRFKQLYLGNHSESDTCSHKLSSHNDQYYHLQKYLPFLLDHPVLMGR